jgi:hypothetical protein
MVEVTGSIPVFSTSHIRCVDKEILLLVKEGIAGSNPVIPGSGATRGWGVV